MRARTALIALLAAAACAPSAQAYVYWTASSANAVARANLDGGGATHSLVAANNPGVLLAYGGHLYWSQQNPMTYTFAIGRASIDGSAATPNWLPLNTGTAVSALATDGTYLYWAASSGAIGRVRLDGTDPEPKFITTPLPVDALAIADGKLYWAAGPEIYSVPTTGGASTLFLGLPVTPAEYVVGMASDGTYLYWTALVQNNSGFGGAVADSPLSSAQDNTLVSGSFLPGMVATDGAHLYWVETTQTAPSPGQIGRGTLNAGTIGDVVHNFIVEPNTPFGIAVDAAIDPTRTTVSCTPSTVATGRPSACTATVTDAASAVAPTGSVNFTGPAAFFSGGPCQLVPLAGGGASCTVGANLTASGNQPITASYSGDSLHQPSSGQTTICSGTATQCGSPPPKRCTVPKLKGQTLPQARKALSRARCTLGKVTKPKHAHGRRLLVASTNPKPGATLASGAKVAVRLAVAPRQRRRG